MPLFGRPAKAADAQALAGASRVLRAFAARYTEEPHRGIRVEDYVTTLAAMTGEAALLSAGLFDLETSEIAPGRAVFGDQINVCLSGDTAELEKVPWESVLGILVRQLVPSTVERDAFGSIHELYANVATRVGAVPWGTAAVTVSEDHMPRVWPIAAAYEGRPSVDKVVKDLGLDANRRYLPCAVALGDAIIETRRAIDVRISLRLALEVVFWTAKMMPMSKRNYASVANTPRPN